MERRKRWPARGAAALAALAMASASLTVGGTSASAAPTAGEIGTLSCATSVSSFTPTKSGSVISFKGNYRVTGCTTTFIVALRLIRGATVVKENRTTSKAPMSATGAIYGSWPCNKSGTYHTETILYNAAFESVIPSTKRSFTC